MHQTMLGVAPAPPQSQPEMVHRPHQRDAASMPANVTPGPPVAPPAAAPGSQAAVPGAGPPAARRPLKQTMVGGLRAAPGSAPGPDDLFLSKPHETTWTVIVQGRQEASMTAADIVRAFAEGRVDATAMVWRDGMAKWIKVGEEPELANAFKRAGLSISRQANAGRPLSEPPGGANRLDSDIDDVTRIANSPFDSLGSSDSDIDDVTRIANSPFDSLGSSDSDIDDVTRIANSPFDSADDGAAATDQLAQRAGLPSRPPARHSVSIDDHVWQELGLNRQAPGAPSSLPPPASTQDLPPIRPATIPQRPAPFSGNEAAPPFPAGAAAEPPTADRFEARVNEVGPVQQQGEEGKGREPARRRRRWPYLLLAVAVLLAALVVSYRTRQPQALYRVLQAHGWDRAIDSTVQRLLVEPYRRVFERNSH